MSVTRVGSIKGLAIKILQIDSSKRIDHLKESTIHSSQFEHQIERECPKKKKKGKKEKGPKKS